jgi:hypothetical protein
VYPVEHWLATKSAAQIAHVPAVSTPVPTQIVLLAKHAEAEYSSAVSQTISVHAPVPAESHVWLVAHSSSAAPAATQDAHTEFDEQRSVGHTATAVVGVHAMAVQRPVSAGQVWTLKSHSVS